MGKGDRRTKRGKIFRGSNGRTRLKKKNTTTKKKQTTTTESKTGSS